MDRAEEAAQQSRAQLSGTIPEDPSSSSALCAHCTHMVHRQTYKQKSYTYKMNKHQKHQNKVKKENDEKTCLQEDWKWTPHYWSLMKWKLKQQSTCSYQTHFEDMDK